MGQHIASLVVLPEEWTRTMRPLQDQCKPTPYDGIQKLFQTDMGTSIEDLFEEFDPCPIGVASLAQVHVAKYKETKQQVAIKLQHPHLAEFCDVDMTMVEVTLGWIKYWFPEFEFTWLGEEMRTNLPNELDFDHESLNASRTRQEFEAVKTSLYIPEVIFATKRVLVMEYIHGARVDDLKFLADHNIDRNKVALELARIFNRMVFLNGWFHADPHPGNILIRPARGSKSPFNFEIVLLDHGLYFDLDPELRINYSKLWLALISPASLQTQMDRRKYAELVGNITPDLYHIFEAAITGRATLEETSGLDKDHLEFKRASGMIDMLPQSELEMEAIRNAVIKKDGIILSVLDVLRRVPRRVLMVLKLNDLTRSLDHALETTHSNARVFLIAFKYCTYAVWLDERKGLIESMKDRGMFSLQLLQKYFCSWWSYQSNYSRMVIAEILMDLHVYGVFMTVWINGMWWQGFVRTYQAAEDDGITNADFSVDSRTH